MLVEVRNSLQELQWILGFLCAEAREHFDSLNRSERWCGAQGRGVLLQEFLEGTEYIVDHVSCDGVHKTTMLWMYDFQEVNGHRVCIAQRPVPYDSSAMAELVAYTRQCLNALGVRNGAAHTEVMWTSGGPCLVEVHTGGSQGKDMRWYEHFEHFAGRTCWSFLIYLDTFCNVSWCWYMLMRKHVKIARFNCAPDVCLFLVQVNCRCQGGTGFWVPLCRKMTGYSQVDAVIGAYLRQESWWFDAASGKIGKENKENGGFHWFQTTSIWNQILIFVEFVEGPERLGLDECFFPTDEIGPWQEAFDALPNTPTFLMFGDIIHLISYEERLITDTAMPGLEAVRGLSSFTDVALNVELDKMMCKTTDSQLQVGEKDSDSVVRCCKMLQVKLKI